MSKYQTKAVKISLERAVREAVDHIYKIYRKIHKKDTGSYMYSVLTRIFYVLFKSDKEGLLRWLNQQLEIVLNDEGIPKTQIDTFDLTQFFEGI